MTHRHYKFWRAETGKVYSHSLCGVDVYIETYDSKEEWDFKETLKENYYHAHKAFTRTDTIDPQIVFETTVVASTCDACESMFGLTVLGAVA